MTDGAVAPVTPEQETTTPNKDFRQSPLAQQTFAELKAARDELAAIKQAASDKAAEQERKELEAKGDYEVALAKLKAEHEAQRAEHDKFVLQSNLKTALLQAGANNPIFIDGVVAQFSGDQAAIAEHVEGLKANEQHAAFFGVQQQVSPGLPPPGTPPPATTGKQNWAQVKQDLTDPTKAKVASDSITAFYIANGKMPPGFD
jgi:hypothetical protein